ncbi:MAG: DUF2219 family protein [Henriciella sp.]|nr:DUF2219 family protein [Henriciella sp.]
MIATSTFAILACQGCVQVNAPSFAYQPTPTNSVSFETISNEPAELSPRIQLDARYQSAEVFERSPFEPVGVATGPLQFSGDTRFSASRLYASDKLAELAGDREQTLITSGPRDTKLLNAEIAFNAPAAQTGFAFDVGVAPRLSVSRDGPFATRRFGGEVRIGQNFDKRGTMGESSWYLFAGADGEALVWEPENLGAMSVSDMALRDQVTIGDIQAGVSFQSGPGQLSFSYIRREVEYRERNLGASDNEDFAGVSFTIKR